MDTVATDVAHAALTYSNGMHYWRGVPHKCMDNGTSSLHLIITNEDK